MLDDSSDVLVGYGNMGTTCVVKVRLPGDWQQGGLVEAIRTGDSCLGWLAQLVGLDRQ